MGKPPPAGRRATAPPLNDETAERAMVIGMCVRNAMEGTIHGGELGDLSLTDEQMAVVNPIARNAIATGLHAEEHYFTDEAARAYLNFQRQLVPQYWERPVLLDDYTDPWQFFASDEPNPMCRRCGRTVVNIGTDERPRWTHVAADGGLNVGCRAASYTPGCGWDDDLPRSWKAAPTLSR
jgi:hypothetical protein